MFSVQEKQHIAKEIERLLLELNHPEMPHEKPRFRLQVDGKGMWSWADIRPNWTFEAKIEHDSFKTKADCFDDLLETCRAVKIRICFINHPNEPRNAAGVDWSKEIALLEQTIAKAEQIK